MSHVPSKGKIYNIIIQTCFIDNLEFWRQVEVSAQGPYTDIKPAFDGRRTSLSCVPCQT